MYWLCQGLSHNPVKVLLQPFFILSQEQTVCRLDPLKQGLKHSGYKPKNARKAC
jgi:hypothetical protein